jgi:phage gpG-like protein
MVISVTTNYSRKIVKQKMLHSGTVTGVIREQVKRNFDALGRPKKWKRNTRATIQFKKNHSPRLILKPNMATGEMKAIATKGRIKTLKTSKGVVVKYVIKNRESKNPIKFSEANRSRVIQPFGNPAANPVRRPARPFLYISRQAYHKITMMSSKRVEEVVMSIANPVGRPGNQSADQMIQDAVNEMTKRTR